ncbi:hypothetical protein C8F01DRAFT_1209757 [Mycena amicta]|nr:hypothetical protein C8F01DRAFT_1209757 [Mycena amicta]
MAAPPVPTRSSSALSEAYVSDAFHRFLKSSLSQAKAERLVDTSLLSSAEGDLMITGPALCLYFAALRCVTNPPSVPLPRSSKSQTPMELSYENCPEAFTVAPIQSLPPELQHDLARIICGLDPIVTPLQPSLNGIAADFTCCGHRNQPASVFQDRYADDLQAALDSGAPPSTPSPQRATFVPPPIRDLPPQEASYLSPPGSAASVGGFPQRSPSPTILTHDSPAIEFIRETLYASIADALERQPSPTAYFASVAHAILEVATTSVTPDNTIVGVLGQTLTLGRMPSSATTPIGQTARTIEDDDNEVAMQCAQQGKPIPPTRMDRVRLMLEQESDEGRRSVEGRAVSFTNRINALSLGMTKLKAFRDRQADVFKVLGRYRDVNSVESYRIT